MQHWGIPVPLPMDWRWYQQNKLMGHSRITLEWNQTTIIYISTKLIRENSDSWTLWFAQSRVFVKSKAVIAKTFPSPSQRWADAVSQEQFPTEWKNVYLNSQLNWIVWYTLAECLGAKNEFLIRCRSKYLFWRPYWMLKIVNDVAINAYFNFIQTQYA